MLARQHGFFAVRVAGAEVASEARRQYAQWLSKSFHGEMSYLTRTAAIRMDIQSFFPGARSVVVFAADYFPYGEGKQPPLDAPPDYVRIAKYALGEDYHFVLHKRLRELVAWMSTQVPGASWRICIDSAPLLERAYAVASGVGFLGKNTMVITPHHGSYYFLACVVTDAQIPPDPQILGTCGTCTRCLDACPTKAFAAPYVLDARRCISYLTIEKRSALDANERSSLGEWVFGCDVCQDVCPYNKRPPLSEIVEFSDGYILHEWEPATTLLGAKSNREFARRFGQSPLSRPGRRRMIERVDAALANRQRHKVVTENQRSSDGSSEARPAGV